MLQKSEKRRIKLDHGHWPLTNIQTAVILPFYLQQLSQWRKLARQDGETRPFYLSISFFVTLLPIYGGIFKNEKWQTNGKQYAQGSAYRNTKLLCGLPNFSKINDLHSFVALFV